MIVISLLLKTAEGFFVTRGNMDTRAPLGHHSFGETVRSTSGKSVRNLCSKESTITFASRSALNPHWFGNRSQWQSRCLPIFKNTSAWSALLHRDVHVAMLLTTRKAEALPTLFRLAARLLDDDFNARTAKRMRATHSDGCTITSRLSAPVS
jgi:hypothetical protein